MNKCIFIKLKLVIKKLFNIIGFDLVKYKAFDDSFVDLKKVIDLLDINLIIDIGANIGQFGSSIYQVGYKNKMISFEPLSSARNKLITNSKKYLKWEVFDQCAIGEFNGEIDLNISKNSSSSSVLNMLDLHKQAADNSIYVDNERVKIFRLDTLMNNFLDSNILLKIDTQGYESKVLDGAPILIQHAKAILCELSLVELYEGQVLWLDLITRLENSGFILWSIEKGFTDKRFGRTLQVDAMFIKKSILS
jgi:FkbM family methyltransferase